MPAERYPPDDPREWIGRAESNLTRSRSRRPGIYLEDLCFDAQQAAEKALKGLLLLRRGVFPYVHDLGELLRLLEEGGQDIPDEVRPVVRLSDYAVEARYPGLAEPVAEKEYEDALTLAELIVEWARSIVQGEEKAL